MTTSGCYTAMDGNMANAGGVFIGGNTASTKTCVDWAIDGYNIHGIHFLYSFADGNVNMEVKSDRAVTASLRSSAITGVLRQPVSIPKWVNYGGVT
jgi:hypothetical protein